MNLPMNHPVIHPPIEANSDNGSLDRTSQSPECEKEHPSTVKLVRGGLVESVHRVSAAVVDSNGTLGFHTGDPYLFTSLRSSAKPFQVIPLVEDGLDRHFGFTPGELAIMSGSHSSEDEHVNAVGSILDKIGLSGEHLRCGTHRPLNREVAMRLDGNYGTVHNNCSGKHAAMLAMSVYHGWSLEDYFLPEHPVQQRILDAVAGICGMSREDVGVGTDGCGVPVFFMPLYNMALGFARFCDHGIRDAHLYGPIREAMLANPLMVAGTGRMDTDLMLAVNGSGKPFFVSKVGAEALPCAGWSVGGNGGYDGTDRNDGIEGTGGYDGTDRNDGIEGTSGNAGTDEGNGNKGTGGNDGYGGTGMGIALKVEDGSVRAEAPAFVGALRALGLLKGDSMKDLERYTTPRIRNFRKEVIGSLETEIDFRHGVRNH